MSAYIFVEPRDPLNAEEVVFDELAAGRTIIWQRAAA